MSNYASKEQIQELMEYVGNNLNLPQLIHHFDRSALYETTERVVGQWIDGKPLYQKVIQGTTGATQSWALIEDLGDDCVVVRCECYLTYNQKTVPAGYSAGGATFDVSLNFNASIAKNGAVSVYISNVSTFANQPVYGIVQYTKTTDTALTYKIGTDDDYSTDERLIGTWIDNKPLYQITLIGTTIDDVTGDIETGLTNIDYCQLVSFQCSNGTYRKNLLDSVAIKEDGTLIAMVADTLSEFTDKTFYATVQYTKTS